MRGEAPAAACSRQPAQVPAALRSGLGEAARAADLQHLEVARAEKASAAASGSGSVTAIEAVVVVEEEDVAILVAGAAVWAAGVDGEAGAPSERSASGVSARALAP
jgi:hypothetical protein